MHTLVTDTVVLVYDTNKPNVHINSFNVCTACGVCFSSL